MITLSRTDKYVTCFRNTFFNKFIEISQCRSAKETTVWIPININKISPRNKHYNYMKTSTHARLKPWSAPEEWISWFIAKISQIMRVYFFRKSVYIMHGNSVKTKKSVLELMYTANEFCKSLSTGEFKW